MATTPTAFPIATVGGAISTNGVGYRAGAFGPMGEQVLGLEAVLPNGSIINTRPLPKYSSGPDLNQLFIGSEGVFGIITQATIPRPSPAQRPRFSPRRHSTASTRDSTAAAELLALGVQAHAVGPNRRGVRTSGYTCCSRATGKESPLNKQRSAQVCTQFGSRDIGPGPTEAYWKDRRQSGISYKQSFLGLPRRTRWDRSWGRGFDYLHLALPISQVLEYRRRCDELMVGTGVRVVEYAIWSRPELFSMLMVSEPENGDNFREDLARVVDQALKLAQDMGGAMEYCHGVGIKLDHLLAREMGAGHDVLRELKRALDPANIMNPGKLGL